MAGVKIAQPKTKNKKQKTKNKKGTPLIKLVLSTDDKIVLCLRINSWATLQMVKTEHTKGHVPKAQH
ncbi:MAG: hypothetical protein ACI883_000272 [Candidatus Azotimanducaceae bacterium]